MDYSCKLQLVVPYRTSASESRLHVLVAQSLEGRKFDTDNIHVFIHAHQIKTCEHGIWKTTQRFLRLADVYKAFFLLFTGAICNRHLSKNSLNCIFVEQMYQLMLVYYQLRWRPLVCIIQHTFCTQAYMLMSVSIQLKAMHARYTWSLSRLAYFCSLLWCFLCTKYFI